MPDPHLPQPPQDRPQTPEPGVMRHAYRTGVNAVLGVADLLAIGGLLWAFAWVLDVRWDDHYAAAAYLAMGLFMITGWSHNLYRLWRGASLGQDALAVFLAWASVVLILLFIAYALKISADYSRRTMLTWFIATPFIMIAFRSAVDYLLGRRHQRGLDTRKVAIIGARELGSDFAKSLLAAPWMGLVPVGFYDDRVGSTERPLVSGPLDVVGNLDTLLEHAQAGKIDIIYITLPMRAEERIKKLIARLSDSTASVYLVPDFFLYDLKSASWSRLGDYPVISVFETPFYGVDGWIKRAEDVVLSCLILAVIALPMLLIAMAVKLASPGPVIFKQRRYGLRGEQIEIWKFRTMTVCEDHAGLTQAKRDDPRVTPLGSFLRRTSLDELPQFFNVLQGQMSIVGPRPHAVAHNEQYRRQISGYMLRHKVKPGITGLAQINGWRGETENLEKMEKRVAYDLAYIRDWSIWLDLKIIFLSIFKGFGGENAY